MTEQPVSLEQFRSTPIVVLYRGGVEGQPTNPFMSAVASGLKNRGLNIVDHPISPEAVEGNNVWHYNYALLGKASLTDSNDPEEIQKQKNRYGDWDDLLIKEKAKAVIGDIPKGAIVITDHTFGEGNAGKILREEYGVREIIGAYRSLDEEKTEMVGIDGVRNLIGPIVDAIRADGKKPVVLNACLDDHLRSFELSTTDLKSLQAQNPEISANYFNPKGNYGLKYALSIKKALDVPIIPLIVDEGYVSEVGIDYNRSWFIDSFIADLESIGVDPKEAVMLADHHLYYLRPEEIKQAGLDRVEILRICPCCVGIQESNNPEYADKMRQLGLNLYPVPASASSNTIEKVLNNLSSKIQEAQ